MTHAISDLYIDKITRVICTEKTVGIRNRKLQAIKSEIEQYFNTDHYMIKNLIGIIERTINDET